MDVISDTQQEEEHYDEDEQTNLQTHDLDVEQDEKQQPLSPVSNSNDQQESQERPSVLMSNELSTPEDIRSSSRGSSINHSDWSANKPRSVTSPSFHKRVSVPGVRHIAYAGALCSFYLAQGSFFLTQPFSYI